MGCVILIAFVLSICGYVILREYGFIWSTDIESQVDRLRKSLAEDAKGGNLFHAWALETSKAPESPDAGVDFGKQPPPPLAPLLLWADSGYPAYGLAFRRGAPEAPELCIAFYRSISSSIFTGNQSDFIHLYINSDYYNNPPPPADVYLDPSPPTNAKVTKIYLYGDSGDTIQFAPGIGIAYGEKRGRH